MASSKPFVGIVGLGYWGKNILRNLEELGVLALACDASPERIAVRKKEFPGVKYTSMFGEVLGDPAITAIVVSTPAATHYELAKAALLAGKDVFVEKPLALTVRHGEELVALAKEKNKILMVGHILQYHPAVIELGAMIKRHDLGDIQYLYSNRLNIGKLRVEENILWSFAPHDISVILALIGQAPVSVSCFGGNYLSRGVHDVTVTALEFTNDVRAHIFVSWLHPFKEQKLVVVGTRAMAVFDDMQKEKLLIYPHRIEWDSKMIPVAHKAEHYAVTIKNAEPLREELTHFLECVKSRKEPLTDGNEGLRVLRILEEAERSLVSPAMTYYRP